MPDADTPARRAAGPELDAGRELDQLVAEQVMGWERHPWHGEDCWWPDWPSLHGGRSRPFPYSTDTPEGWAAMKAVIERMRELGFQKFQLSLMMDGSWVVDFTQILRLPEPPVGGLARESTAPEAVCHAALDAHAALAARGAGGGAG